MKGKTMLKSLTKAIIGTAVLPIDLAVDFVTLGGTLSDDKKSSTAKRLKHIGENVDQMTKSDK
tara:strand:- start:69 stop:257 length:189 start_codon:yes stop_codon:yes gene_type:complete